MGDRHAVQAALFYEFSLETHVPTRHLLRSIDRFVELDGLRRELAPFYSDIGRPSIDPELMIRMLLVGYCFGIRSERRLCEEVHLNLAYRWFCRLELDGSVPDHSTFSKNRHGRFRESDLLRRLFESMLRRCIDEGLVGGEGFAVDASLIQADASDRNRVEGTAGLPPEAAGRAVEEYLAVLDDAAFGAASEVTPKFIAPADPATRWTAAHRGPAFFAYSTNYLIDVDNAIIVDVEATTAIRQAEILAAKRMIERSMERFDLHPARLIGDTAYGAAEMLNWLVHEHGIVRRPRRVPPRRHRPEPPQTRKADPCTRANRDGMRRQAPLNLRAGYHHDPRKPTSSTESGMCRRSSERCPRSVSQAPPWRRHRRNWRAGRGPQRPSRAPPTTPALAVPAPPPRPAPAQPPR